MTIPLLALTMMIALLPALGMVDSVLAIGVILTILAVALGVTAFTTPIVRLERFARLMQPTLVGVLAAPAVWMTIQLLPMPVQALNNQIWVSAASALNQPLAGAITIDVGATLLALAHYGIVIAAMIVASAIALDQERAADLLYVLIAITTMVAAGLIIIELGVFDPGRATSEEFVLIAFVGTVLSCAGVLRLYDQSLYSGKPLGTGAPTPFVLAATCVAFAISTVAVISSSEAGSFVATLLGIAMLGAIFVIRRWSLGLWGKAGLATSAVVVLLGTVAIVPIRHNVDLAVAWSMYSPIAAERMLADVPFVGSGAGTYQALLPIYRDISASASSSPTAAATIMIEMGRAFFVGLIVVVLYYTYVLFSRALRRRQDYVFACVGAAILAAVPLFLYVSSGVMGLAASLLTGVVVGLALGQSLSSRDVAGSLTRAVRSQAHNVADAPSGILPRGALMLLALVLSVQAVWILGAEGYESGKHRLLQQNAAAGAAHDDIRKAASFAVVRGDLWTKSARVQIARLDVDDTAARTGFGSVRAREDLESALRYAPSRSDAWLLLALLAERRKPAGYEIGALLKMSYYTAPNDMALLPLRLDVALRAEMKTPDTELQEMIRRDISLIVTREPGLRPALAAAYRSASPLQRSFAERLISEVDPDYLKIIRTQ